MIKTEQQRLQTSAGRGVFPRAKPQLGIGNTIPTAIIRFRKPKHVSMSGQIRTPFLFSPPPFFWPFCQKLTYIYNNTNEKKFEIPRREKERERFEKLPFSSLPLSRRK